MKDKSVRAYQHVFLRIRQKPQVTPWNKTFYQISPCLKAFYFFNVDIYDWMPQALKISLFQTPVIYIFLFYFEVSAQFREILKINEGTKIIISPYSAQNIE